MLGAPNREIDLARCDERDNDSCPLCANGWKTEMETGDWEDKETDDRNNPFRCPTLFVSLPASK